MDKVAVHDTRADTTEAVDALMKSLRHPAKRDPVSAHRDLFKWHWGRKRRADCAIKYES